MKKIKLIVGCVIFFAICILFNSKVEATSISVTPQNPKVGDTVTITVTVANVHTVSVTAEITGAISGEIKLVNGNLAGNKDTFSTSKTFQCNNEGNVEIKISDDSSAVADGENVDVGAFREFNIVKATQSETSDNNNNNSNNSSSSNNQPADTEEEEKSSNANLASLTIGSGTLTPRFSKSTTTYAVTLEDDVTSFTVNAKAEDSKATVDISGNTNLKEGRNPITILVTAEDGTTKTYTINAIKDGTQEEEEEEEETTSSYVKLGLESLSIEGVTLDPKFDPSTYTYNVTIKDNSITSLNVNAIATDENATVEIVGNENLQPGENIVTIIITSENGEDIRVYQIFVTKTTEEAAEVPEENNNMQMWYIVGGSVAGVLILLIIILIVVKKKRKKKTIENKSNKKEESVEIEIENKPVEKKKKTNKKSDKGKH